MSSSWVEHGRRFASEMTSNLGLVANDLVLEIASNDGYLLRSFKSAGTKVLGVEPAANVARIAAEAGVPTINRFFGADCAADIVARHGRPRLIVANNVLAHVPDLDGFLAGLRTLCSRETTMTIENPSFLRLMVEGQFDTIYHEHFSYLTAHAVARAAEPHGLDLVRVDSLTTHGGSNRYWLRLAGPERDPSVQETLEAERRGGLFDPQRWESFAAGSHAAITGLGSWLAERQQAGALVAAYGAAAKGNTFLNAVGPLASSIRFVVDASPEKQGRYLPGSRVPVLAPTALNDQPIDDVLILPWNLAPEIAPLARSQAPESRIWVALPEMTQL